MSIDEMQDYAHEHGDDSRSFPIGWLYSDDEKEEDDDRE